MSWGIEETMKSSARHLLLALFFLSTAFGQQWQWQNPYPQGNFISDVWTLDSLTIVALADHGTILKTTNAGSTWNVQYLKTGTIPYFRDIQFIHDTGWALGGTYGVNRFIFETTDRGDTWTLNSSMANEIQSLFFINGLTGWVVGIKSVGPTSGLILKTTNGGKSWFDQTPDSVGVLIDVFFTDSLHGWVVGPNGTVLRTKDGGNSWQQRNTGDVNEYVAGVYFVNNSVGWVVGNGYVSHGFIKNTSDGGDSWTLQLVTNDDNLFKKLYFTNPQVGFVPGFSGYIYATWDGGNTWTTIPTSERLWLTNVHFCGQNNGWAVGDKGIIVRTQDGGRHWFVISKGARENLQSIVFVDSLIGWAAGNNGIVLHTENGGESWISTVLDSLTSFRSASFPSRTKGWIVGSRQSSEGIIYEVSGGGLNWNKKTFPALTSFLSVDFVDSITGWVLGYKDFDKSLFQTINGGKDWNIIFRDTSGSFYYSVEFTDKLSGWMVGGTKKRLLNTIDGGITWNDKSQGINVGISDVSFIGQSFGWAVGGYEQFSDGPSGGRGFIYHTVNGGNSWMVQDTSAPHQFTAVYFVDSLYGWAVAYRGYVYRTTNGGLTWDGQVLPTDFSLYSLDFIGREVGWLCGDDGLIVKTSNGGQIAYLNDRVRPNAATFFFLTQNFPNPFNGQTIIKYKLENAQNVTLSIYDMLGRCVRTLINGSQRTGEYSTIWDGKNNLGDLVSSGAYVYRLEAGAQFSAKKMIFLR